VLDKVAGGVGSSVMRYSLYTPRKNSPSADDNRKDTLFAFEQINGIQLSIFHLGFDNITFCILL
jgi:hypothetical protein